MLKDKIKTIVKVVTIVGESPGGFPRGCCNIRGKPLSRHLPQQRDFPFSFLTGAVRESIIFLNSLDMKFDEKTDGSARRAYRIVFQTCCSRSSA